MRNATAIVKGSLTYAIAKDLRKIKRCSTLPVYVAEFDFRFWSVPLPLPYVYTVTAVGGYRQCRLDNISRVPHAQHVIEVVIMYI